MPQGPSIVTSGGVGVATDVHLLADAARPTGFYESTPRNTKMSNCSVLSSGRMSMQGIVLPAGFTVTNITVISADTAANGPTAWWFALYDSSRVLLRQTADQTTTAWAANTTKTIALSSTFTTTYAGLHYIGCMVAASTAVPTLQGPDYRNDKLAALTPKLWGSSDTGLTTTAPATATAITEQASTFWAAVS